MVDERVGAKEVCVRILYIYIVCGLFSIVGCLLLSVLCYCDCIFPIVPTSIHVQSN